MKHKVELDQEKVKLWLTYLKVKAAKSTEKKLNLSMDIDIIEAVEAMGYYFIDSSSNDMFYFEWEDRSAITDRDLDAVEDVLSDLLGQYNFDVRIGTANTLVVETYLLD